MTALQEARQANHTSIGMVKPDKVVRAYAEEVSEEDHREWWERHAEYRLQLEIDFEIENEARPVRELPPPDYRFKIEFVSAGKVHDFTIFDWG